MYKFVIAVLLSFFMMAACMAQTLKPIDSFLGIKLGSSKQFVFDAIKAKGGHLGSISNTTKDSVWQIVNFNDIKFGGTLPEYFSIQFFKDRAFYAAFTYDFKEEQPLLDFYSSMTQALNDTYGQGKVTKKFTSPYKEGDKGLINAFENDKAEYLNVWEANGNRISLSIKNLYPGISADEATLSITYEIIKSGDEASAYYSKLIKSDL